MTQAGSAASIYMLVFYIFVYTYTYMYTTIIKKSSYQFENGEIWVEWEGGEQEEKKKGGEWYNSILFKNV